jgi:hypothetical protein
MQPRSGSLVCRSTRSASCGNAPAQPPLMCRAVSGKSCKRIRNSLREHTIGNRIGAKPSKPKLLENRRPARIPAQALKPCGRVARS